MSLDQQVISHIIKNPSSLGELQRAGVTADWFNGDWAKLVNFLMRMREKHGKVPSLEVVQTRFKKFEPVKTKKRDFPMLVEELHQRRKRILLLTALDDAARGTDDPDEIDAVIASLQTDLSNLSLRHGDSSLVDIFGKEAQDRMKADLKERRAGGTIGIPTGLKRLDYAMGGLQKGRFVITAARTGIGKSWMNLIFVASAVTNGYKVGLYPLEMTVEEVALRLYTVFSQIEYGPGKALKNLDLAHGRITVKKCVKLMHLLEDKYEGQLFVADMGRMSDPYTIARIDAEQAVYGFDMNWIDYITLLKAPGVGRDGQEDHMTVKALSNGCKQMAVKHRMVVGASAQFNRAAVTGRQFLPRLEHLAFGDSIGADCDGAISMNRKGPYLYYSLVKHRGGPEVPKTRVLWNPDEGEIREDENQIEDEEDDD